MGLWTEELMWNEMGIFLDFGQKSLLSPTRQDASESASPEAGEQEQTSDFMAVSLRLKREGAKGRPFYRIVATDSRSRRDGRAIESLGTYDPMKKGLNFELDLDRVDHWISVGGRMSETVGSLVKKARKSGSAKG